MPANKAHLLTCMRGLYSDQGELESIDNYLHGRHPDPYMPRLADDEYRLLAKRCITNLTPMLVHIPAQSLYVDGVRSGKGDGDEAVSASHWAHWQRSRLDSGQTQVHRSALAYGHAFVVTERNGKNEVVSRGLSPMRTYAVYANPATDIDPVAAFTVDSWETAETAGKGTFWDETHVYEVEFKHLQDDNPVIRAGVPHGAMSCPVTRFAAAVDLEGRTCGVIAPMKVLQDRMNQTVFDLLVAQSGGSFVTRTVTGMAPPMEMRVVEETDPIDGETTERLVPKLDRDGNPIPQKIRLSASDILYAENPDTKFGSMPGTPLEGYIASLAQVLRHFTTTGQIPPHYMLGEIANLSAEALQAAETSLSRKVQEFRTVFGESWERVFCIAASLEGDDEAANDYAAEVLWRDMDAQAMSKTSDALVKLRELGIPPEGLWGRIPGVTQKELDHWKRLAEEQPDAELAAAMSRATSGLSASGGEDRSTPSTSTRPAWSA